MAYGLFQGLNEAYDAYRQRESEIAAEEQAALDEERAAQLFEQQQEEYDYGVSQRPLEERAAQAGVEAQEIAVKTARQQYEEMMTPEAIAQRKETARLELEALKRTDRTGRRQEEWDKIQDRAIKQAERYRDWKTKFMRGQMSMEQLVQAFNADDDESNNVASVTGNEKNGWTVTYENGDDQFFEDKYAVAIELEGMADSNFHQTYLLQVDKNKQALKVALAKDLPTPEDLRPFRNDWEKNTRASLDRLKGTMIKEGIVDFGEEGNRRVAIEMAALANWVGQKAQYQGLSNSEVIARIEGMMAQDTDLGPEATRRRAEEKYELIDEELLVGGKPEKGEPGYEAQINRLMEDDIGNQIEQLRDRLGNSYFMGDGEGGYAIKPNYMDWRNQDLGLQSGDASTSAGQVTTEPDKPDMAAMVAEEARAYAPTPQEQQVADDLIEARKQQQGLKIRRGKLVKPTAAQKRALRSDYEKNFYRSMDPVTQQRWLSTFGSVLSPKERERAQQAIDEALAERQYGVQYSREMQEETERYRIPGEEEAAG